MRIAGIIKDSIVNGVGIRDVLFTQGCPHHCKGCQNPETWNFAEGEIVSTLELLEEFSGDNNLTISGGEPLFTPNLLELNFLYPFKKRYPNKTIWIYTGYKFEDISEETLKLLDWYNIEVIVDGRYEEDKRDAKLKFRGSSNQRLIDFKKTRKTGQIVLWEENQ
jgi:anaerobic ribonucleoside-triphosphate reductase activating protein